MNILVTYDGSDIATYNMLKHLSEDVSFKIYIAAPTLEEAMRAGDNITPLLIPPISSKFSWKAIRALRRLIKQHAIDVIFSPSSAGLSNALFASIGTKAKNIGYRGTQAKVRKADLTYYLGVLNPRVKHIVCETEDIRDYLSHLIQPDKLSVNVKPFDVAWVEDACKSPKQDLFILPALRDASPRVVREAMACGVPCLVTDIPGARDLIDSRSGVLVPSASPEKMSEAIGSLMDDRIRLQALAKASRERIIRDFSVVFMLKNSSKYLKPLSKFYAG